MTGLELQSKAGIIGPSKYVGRAALERPRPWPKGSDPMDGNDDITSAAKICTKCGELKALGEYGPKKGNRDGRQGACRSCCSAAVAAWKRANPERARAIGLRYREAHPDRRAQQYAANPERWREQSAKWRAANVDRVRETKHLWHLANRERRAAADAARYRADPERRRRRAAEYRAVNRERDREKARLYRVAHPDRVRAANAAWAASHPNAVREKAAARRAIKRNAPVFEPVHRDVVWERDRGRCHICGRKADPSNWHLEHIVPLSAGGEHSYRNVAVSHPACNLRKGTTGPAQLRLRGDL